MHFGFALDSSDIDLLNIDFLDAHLDLLDTDIPSKQFVCLQDVLKTNKCLLGLLFSKIFYYLLKSYYLAQQSNFFWPYAKELHKGSVAYLIVA